VAREPDFRHVEVIAPNLSLRYSGLTSTLIALLPVMRRRLVIAALSRHVPVELPHVWWRDVLRHGWSPPPGRPFRLWHARGNHDMIAGIVLARFLRQPMRLLFTSAGQRRHSRFTRMLLREMDALIATSPESAGFLARPAAVIPHGVDTERFRPATDRAWAWAEMGVAGRYGIGILGRIRHQKGTDLFVDAMIALLPEHPDWTAVIIGPLPPEHDRYLNGLRARIASAGMSDRIRFVGEQQVEEIPRWHRALSIVVAPPRSEGFGLLPLEAMASGTPVVASRAGAHATVIDDPRSGRLVPPGDGAALTGAIRELMEASEAERDALGRAGRARIEAEFSIENEAAAIAAVYERLWRSGRRRADEPIRPSGA